MQRIVISALKGGTGKSTSTVNIARALSRLDKQVGLLDIDVIAPTLHKALGMGSLPSWDLDSLNEQIRPFKVDGLFALTIASHYGEDPAVMWDEPTLIRAMKELNSLVQWPELDYLLLDSPPSSSGFMQALYDFVPDIYGVILVFQPTDIAAADLLRTLDFVRIKKVPIIGLVSNMGYCIAPNGDTFWPFLSPKVELGEVCQQYGIHFLGDVPLTPRQDTVDSAFDIIAREIITTKPIILKDDIAIKLYKAIKRKGLKTILRRL